MGWQLEGSEHAPGACLHAYVGRTFDLFWIVPDWSQVPSSWIRTPFLSAAASLYEPGLSRALLESSLAA